MKKVLGLLLLATIAAQKQNNITSNSTTNTSKYCVNPNNRGGTCVATQDCQVLLQSERSFVEASRCDGGFGTSPYVCCSSDTGFNTDARAVAVNELPNNSNERWWTKQLLLLPEPPTCGGEFIDNRIYGGADADLYEFPWMAFLEYAKSDPTRKALCAGSLINSRYILTAAHCVVGIIILRNGELIAAHLGLTDYTRMTIFSKNIQRWKIEEKIIHENYKEEKTFQNDVALLRLENNVRYSKTIRPICLPSALSAYSLKVNTKLTVAGWGATNFDSSSPIKQKVRVPLRDQKVCKQQFSKLGLTIKASHICAGGTANKDSCHGDSGGPLMHYRSGVWVLEGVVSFGLQCGLKGWPGVYARVSSFNDWIINNLRD